MLDIDKAGSNGLSSLETFDQLQEKPPIVVMSGLDSESLSVEAIRLGAEAYLVKGSTSEVELRRAVRIAVERHKRAEFQNCLSETTDPMLRLSATIEATRWAEIEYLKNKVDALDARLDTTTTILERIHGPKWRTQGLNSQKEYKHPHSKKLAIGGIVTVVVAMMKAILENSHELLKFIRKLVGKE